jgi:hypothetical protein
MGWKLMRNALVIGGTGMLAPIAVWLAKKDYHVYVIGRSNERLENLGSRIGKNNFTPIQVDYRDKQALKKKLLSIKSENARFDLVLAWVRTNAEASLAEIIKLNSSKGTNSSWSLLHVLGSQRNPYETMNSFEIPADCIYRQVQLGFKIEGEVSRWLTNEEISSGVIGALSNSSPLNIIGQTEPPEMRPRY